MTPTEDLVMEVLAARWRTGERVWTFSRSRPLTIALSNLTVAGLVNYKSGVEQDTYLVWMTEAGREQALDEKYVTPIAKRPKRTTAQIYAETIRELTKDPKVRAALAEIELAEQQGLSS